MPVVNTTNSFSNNEQITSTKLNNIMDNSFFVTAAVVTDRGLNVTTGGQLEVPNGGIKTALLEDSTTTSNGVTTAKIANGAVTPAKLSTGAPSWSGTTTTMLPAIELGGAITTSGSSYIDFHSVFPLTDYDARLVRDSGANGAFRIQQNGTGAIILTSSSGVTFGSANMPTPSGSAPVYGARAWVNFNGQANTNLGGTYTRTSTTTVTIDTTSDHGLIAGNVVYLDFTVGTGTAPFDGLYLVNSVIDSNTFTVISSVNTASTGTVSLVRKTIRANGNVANVSVAYSGANPASPPASDQTIDNGYYVVNFTTAMTDANFAISGACNESGTFATGSGNDIVGGFGYNEKCAFVTTISGGGTAASCLHNSVQIIR
jgi:hypothetical protein